jgi:cytochrome c556
MLEIERLMQPIDRFILGEPADAAVLREDATAIEAMLLAFPHLFPPTTNRYDATVLDPPTIALPAIWQSFDAFLAQAEAAERAAAELISADDDASLREAGTRLRAACDVCHAAFAKPYTPPIVTEQDRNFDFESVLPQE